MRTIWSRTQPGETELAPYFGDVNRLAFLLAMQSVSVQIWSEVPLWADSVKSTSMQDESGANSLRARLRWNSLIGKTRPL